MPEEKDLERQRNKMVISKIIHTENLSDMIAENIINKIYNKFPYIKRKDNENNSYWTGFTSDYIYSCKYKNNDIRHVITSLLLIHLLYHRMIDLSTLFYFIL